MKLTYWTGFSKRKNSTKQPTGGTQLDVVWKEDTSIDAPSVILKGNNVNIDYAYIADWGKYYHVNAPILLTNGLTQYDLEEDVLATHKTGVAGTVAHIVRSSTGYDAMLVDSLLPVKTTKSIKKAVYDPGIFDGTGCFLLSITNVQSSANGFASSYVCDRNTLDNVASILMNMDITQMVIKSIYKPFECIISCTWLPIKISIAQAQCTAGNIFFGEYDSHISGYKLTSPTISNIGNFSITPTYSDFRMTPPYTTYSLLLPFYGVVDLNASDIRNMIASNSLSVGWYLDIASGDFTVGVFTAGGVIGQSFNYNIGVNCPIAQTSNNMTGTISSIGGTAGGILGAVASLAMGNAPGVIASGLGALTGAASVAMNYNSRSTSIKGGINGRAGAALGGEFVLAEYAMNTADPNNANYIAKWGRPVGVTHAISNHSGYVQCEDASIDIAGDAWEKEQINSYLNSGFYYE